MVLILHLSKINCKTAPHLRNKTFPLRQVTLPKKRMVRSCCDELGSSDDDVSNHEDNYLTDELRNWACMHAIKHHALNDLSAILGESHPELPADARILLGTPRQVHVKV